MYVYIEYHEEALSIRLNELGENHVVTAESYQHIATLLVVLQKDIPRALRYCELALQARRLWCKETYPDGYVKTKIVVSNASPNKPQSRDGKPHSRDGERPKSRSTILNKKDIHGHPLIASSLQTYAEVLLMLNRLDEAKLAIDEAIAMRKDTISAKSSATSQSLHTQGIIHARIKQYHRELYDTRMKERQSNVIASKLQNNDDITLTNKQDKEKDNTIVFINVEMKANEIEEDIVIPYQQLDFTANQCHMSVVDAADCRDVGQYHVSLPVLNKVLEVIKNKFGLFHPSLGILYTHYGMLYEDQEQYAMAEEYYIKALGR